MRADRSGTAGRLLVRDVAVALLLDVLVVHCYGLRGQAPGADADRRACSRSIYQPPSVGRAGRNAMRGALVPRVVRGVALRPES